MKNISNFVAEETRGKSYKSHKYCLDNYEIPSVTFNSAIESFIKA